MMLRAMDVGRRITDPTGPAARAWLEEIQALQRRHRMQVRALEAFTERSVRRGETPRSYSKTSWQRVLSGEVLPPEWAIRILCEWKNEDPDRLLALAEEVANEIDQKQATQPEQVVAATPPVAAQPSDPVVTGPPRRAWVRLRRPVFAYAIGGAVACAVAAVIWLPSGEDAQGFDPRSGSESRGPSVAAPCHGSECVGHLADARGCRDDARTIDQLEVGTRLLQVRYSEICASAWAFLAQAQKGDTLTLRDGTAPEITKHIMDAKNARTTMVGAQRRHQVTACVQPEGSKDRACVDAAVGHE